MQKVIPGILRMRAQYKRAYLKHAYYLASIFRLITGIREWPLVLRVFLGLAPAGVKTIRLRRNGLRFRVRGPMDIWSVKETFLDCFYERYGTVIEDGWMVVDIGAGIGDFTLQAAWDHPHNQVYAFEPFGESFALLEENLRLNRAVNARAFPEAVGALSGSLVLDLSGGEPLQLRSYGAEERPASRQALPVSCLSLADVFARLGLDGIDLLKMDCEGAEYSILFNTPRPFLERIQRIVMEFHEGVNGHTHTDLALFLQEHGFEVRTAPNRVHGHLGYLYAWRRRG